MATAKSPQNGPIDPSVAKQALSFVYIAAWVYTYWFRAAVVGKLVRWLLIILTLIELAGPVLHMSSEHWPLEGKYAFVVLLFFVAVTLTLHHRRLDSRLSRHNVILSSIRLLVEEGALDATGDASADIRKILESLVFCIRSGRPESLVVNATVLVRSSDGPFRIAAQDSYYLFDAANLSIDRNNSVAGKVADDESDAVVIYVPSTYFFHGVRIDLLKEFPTREFFRTTEIISNAFQWLGDANQSAVKSLVCMRVQVSEPDVDAVLCVSGNQVDSIGYVELTAIRVLSGFIAQALKAPGASIVLKKHL